MADKLFRTYFNEKNEPIGVPVGAKLLAQAGADEPIKVDVSNFASADQILELGETATTAYRGDRGAEAYTKALASFDWGDHRNFGLGKDVSSVSDVFNQITGFYRALNSTTNAPTTREGYFLSIRSGSLNYAMIYMDYDGNLFYGTNSGGFKGWQKVPKEIETQKKRTKKVITATSYQLLPTDVDRFLYFTAATEVTLIVPTGLSEDMEFLYMQRGDGQVNPTAASGITVNKSASFTKKTANKFSPAAIRMFSTTEADVFGTLELA